MRLKKTRGLVEQDENRNRIRASALKHERKLDCRARR